MKAAIVNNSAYELFRPLRSYRKSHIRKDFLLFIEEIVASKTGLVAIYSARTAAGNVEARTVGVF